MPIDFSGAFRALVFIGVLIGIGVAILGYGGLHLILWLIHHLAWVGAA